MQYESFCRQGSTNQGQSERPTKIECQSFRNLTPFRNLAILQDAEICTHSYLVFLSFMLRVKVLDFYAQLSLDVMSAAMMATDSQFLKIAFVEALEFLPSGQCLCVTGSGRQLTRGCSIKKN